MATNHYGSQSTYIPNRFDTSERKRQVVEQVTQRPDVPAEAPPSPTLTNPDMILPFENERESSTPSPPFRFTSSETHVSQNGQLLPSNYQGSGFNYHGDLGTATGGAGLAPSRPPRPRWTYEGHAPSRPLSDIGEEDIQAISPALGGKFPRDALSVPDKETDSCSTASSSTISANSRGAQENRQNGARPDSKRSSYASQGSIEAARAQTSDALVSGDPQLEENSSAILSSEAERILENAKKRLTLMEGNLTRARSSIRLTPSPSLQSSSPLPSGSLLPARNLQPAGELYRSISQTDRRSSMFRPRSIHTAPQESGHSRGHSETNVPTDADSNTFPLQPSRSMSALASFNATQHDADENSFSNHSPRANGNSRSASGFYQPRLDSLREGDNYGQSYYGSESDHEGPAGLGISAPNRATKMSSMEDFNSAYPIEKPPSRAQSQLQVRDLKDQAAGLRTKVALLKVKTQEDNLRRRSLQSLRTPSPFTAAEQWYTSAMEHQQGSPNISNNAGYGWIPENSGEQENYQDTVSEEEKHHAGGFANGAVEESAHIDHRAPDYDYDIGDDTQSMYSTYEDAEEGDYDDEIDREALDRILSEPFDDDDEEFQDFPSDSAPEATPHEEREDAFDYENFYLHSALGTYSQSMRRRSYGSTGSTETTRPPPHEQRMKHGRNGSADSVSTLATFATATENAYSDYEDEDGEDGQHVIDQALGWDENEDDVATPVQSRRATVVSRSSDSQNQGAKAIPGNGMLTPPGSAAREQSTPTTPVDAFMSTLSKSTSRPPSSLGSDDTRVLEQLFESLGKVCTELQELTLPSDEAAHSEADPKYIRTLRRRLDAARRALDGQLD
ncbi:hypothetical protein PISL3812_02231 [Talaromyces islandicus]|uniref:Uncharacterized protein n=1 Tax=Talaromyces islandicus TaxID=28573 RepID=A0A0U1LPB6_TALIS|nr:hypothetical protein PISL3812_02231 [Talaromyces islandicus]